jgi:hypothetical protein
MNWTISNRGTRNKICDLCQEKKISITVFACWSVRTLVWHWTVLVRLFGQCGGLWPVIMMMSTSISYFVNDTEMSHLFWLAMSVLPSFLGCYESFASKSRQVVRSRRFHYLPGASCASSAAGVCCPAAGGGWTAL